MNVEVKLIVPKVKKTVIRLLNHYGMILIMMVIYEFTDNLPGQCANANKKKVKLLFRIIKSTDVMIRDNLKRTITYHAVLVHSHA